MVTTLSPRVIAMYGGSPKDTARNPGVESYVLVVLTCG
jgi:hypothetical protein